MGRIGPMLCDSLVDIANEVKSELILRVEVGDAPPGPRGRSGGHQFCMSYMYKTTPLVIHFSKGHG